MKTFNKQLIDRQSRALYTTSSTNEHHFYTSTGNWPHHNNRYPKTNSVVNVDRIDTI